MTGEQNNYHFAIGYVAITTLSSVGTNALLKTMGTEIDPITIVFLRNIFAIVPLWLWMQHKNILPDITPQKLWQHFPRTLTGMLSYASLIYAVQIMPLANATAVSLTQPLFVALLAPLLLKEHLRREPIIMTVIGFLGILLILKPTAEMPVGDALIILFHPVLFALALINVRHLSKTESAMTITFFYTIFNILLSAPWAIFHLPNLTPYHVFIVALVAGFGVLLQYSQGKAMQHAPATFVAPFYYMSQIWGLLLGIIFWNEWPDAWAWLGIILIIGMGITLNYIARRRHFTV